MKAVIQRVLSASVTVNKEVVSSIGRGFLVLVAANPPLGPPLPQRGSQALSLVSPNDTVDDGKCLAKKLLSLKMWPTENKPWAQSVKDISGEILCVSQFTLFANISKGSKPDFHGSATPDIARPLYDQLIETLKRSYITDRVKDGVFGAMMEVALVNDGPVTFEFDTAKSGNVSAQKEKDAKRKKWEEKKAAGKKPPGNDKTEAATSTSCEKTEETLKGLSLDNETSSGSALNADDRP